MSIKVYGNNVVVQNSSDDLTLRADPVSRVIKFNNPILAASARPARDQEKKLVIAEAGTATLTFDDVYTTNYNVRADIVYDDGTIGFPIIKYDTATRTSIQVEVYAPGTIRYSIILHK
jgi:hypothetical protein